VYISRWIVLIVILPQGRYRINNNFFLQRQIFSNDPCFLQTEEEVHAAGHCGGYGVSQDDIAAYGRKRGTEDYKWRACLIPCRLVFENGNHRIPVTGGFLRQECQKLFSYKAAQEEVEETPEPVE
jgi:hypothetical protein